MGKTSRMTGTFILAHDSSRLVIETSLVRKGRTMFNFERVSCMVEVFIYTATEIEKERLQRKGGNSCISHSSLFKRLASVALVTLRNLCFMTGRLERVRGRREGLEHLAVGLLGLYK